MALILAPWALLAVAAMWGISFVWMKDILDRQDVFSFLTSRFVLTFAVMLLFRPSIIKKFTPDLIRKGFVIGAALGSGFALQTLGLERVTPATAGFVTGLYVILTPVLGYLFLKEHLSREAWFYVGLATAGLGVLSLKGLTMGFGEFLVFLSTFFYAGHILLLSRWSKGFDAYALTVMQMISCSLLSLIPTSIHGYTAPADREVWGVVLFCAIFASALAFVIQTWSQARISATKVAVILMMEVVFAAFFSVVLGREQLTARLIIGGAMVVVAMVAIVQPRFHEKMDHGR
jgi:drug/metabolite transporter (DMT)-like permease